MLSINALKEDVSQEKSAVASTHFTGVTKDQGNINGWTAEHLLIT